MDHLRFNKQKGMSKRAVKPSGIRLECCTLASNKQIWSDFTMKYNNKRPKPFRNACVASPSPHDNPDLTFMAPLNAEADTRPAERGTP